MALGELPVLSAPAVAASPLHNRVVFLVGSPESAASTLEVALLTAPGVVGYGQPSRILSAGVGEVLASLGLGAEPERQDGGPAGDTGVSVLAGPQAVLAAVRELTDSILGSAGEGLIVEYTPDHASLSVVLSALYPDAVVVLVDVVAPDIPARTVAVTSAEISSDVDSVVDAVLATARPERSS